MDSNLANTDPKRQYWDEAIETLPREELESLQLDRLRSQLARVAGASIFYRERMEAVGMEPEDVRTIDDLQSLPVVTKEELRLDQAAHPPFGSFAVADRADWREVHPSTGTTGAPVKTIWTATDVETITAFTARTLWQFGTRAGDIVQNAFAYGLWVAGMSCHYGAQQLGATVIPIGTGVTSDTQLHYLDCGATVLLSTPSYALHLAETVRERGMNPEALGLRIGCFGGEPGAENPATRAKIESGLGLQAFDYYGLAEVGPTFASECQAKEGIHFAEDHVLVECVDAETLQSVPHGELGVLVFTHLTRQGSPMIRYFSNDYARLTAETCSCGRTHMRAVGGIVGRSDDLVVFKGAKFYPSQVERVVRDFDALSAEFYLEIVRDPGAARVAACTVVAEWAAEPVSDITHALKSALRSALGVTPALRIEPFGTLERTTFKAKRVREVPG